MGSCSRDHRTAIDGPSVGDGGSGSLSIRHYARGSRLDAAGIHIVYEVPECAVLGGNPVLATTSELYEGVQFGNPGLKRGFLLAAGSSMSAVSSAHGNFCC